MRNLGGAIPLISAVQSGNKKVVEICLNEGMNPFAIDLQGNTALEYAYQFTSVGGQDMRDLIKDARS